MMQIWTSATQTPMTAAMTPSARTPWAATSVPVNLVPSEMDSPAQVSSQFAVDIGLVVCTLVRKLRKLKSYFLLQFMATTLQLLKPLLSDFHGHETPTLIFAHDSIYAKRAYAIAIPSVRPFV